VGEVSEGLVLDLIALAVGSAQEVGFVDASLVGASGGGYMNGTGSAGHTGTIAVDSDQVKPFPAI
jgi:hypothetical protein